MKGIVQLLGYGLFWLLFVVLTFGVGIIVFALVAFLTFGGALQRREKLAATMTQNLMPGEKIIFETTQNRTFGLWNRRKALSITDSRVIQIQRGLLGGFKMQDIQWKDLRDATIEQNVLPSICGSNLSFRHSNSNSGIISIDGVDEDIAPKIYGKAQFEEQAWEEKRRVRAMEETRAAAGGVTVHSAPMNAGSSSQAPNDMLNDIQRAKTLLESGAISDSEFQEMKSKILAR